MATQYTDKADWQELDPASLPAHCATAYADYKAKYREMKANRDSFEQAMQAGVPAGHRMVFGYRFGKLSVAIVKAEDAPKPKAQVARKSLADYLAQARANGRAA